MIKLFWIKGGKVLISQIRGNRGLERSGEAVVKHIEEIKSEFLVNFSGKFFLVSAIFTR